MRQLPEREMHTEYRQQNWNEADNFEDLSIDGRIILKWSELNEAVGRGQDLSGTGRGSLSSFCEHSKEHAKYFSLSEQLLRSQGGSRSVELLSEFR